MVQVLSTTRDVFRGIGNPTSRAVCVSFKSLLKHETPSAESGIPPHGSVGMVQVPSTTRDIFRGIGNPTSRQCVVRSSPFYNTRHLSSNRESHITAVCGWFRAFLEQDTSFVWA